MKTKTKITRPEAGEYAPYYEHYIGLVTDPDPLHLMKRQVMDLQALLAEVPPEKEDYRYAEGKWTIKEVVGHITDSERVFAYRALRIARNDKTPLPGFEQDDYVANGNFNQRSLPDLAREYALVREASNALFRSFSEEQLLRSGTANNMPVSVRALLYIIAGHQVHHEQVLKQKYLPELF